MAHQADKADAINFKKQSFKIKKCNDLVYIFSYRR